jgi:hypothetical protein
MRNNRRSRIGRDTAEQLLGSIPAGRRPSDPLVRLLAAAGAQAQPGELRGEAAALAAFRAADLATDLASDLPARATVGRRSRVRKTFTRLLTLEVGAILAVTTVGGVALAATTGALPNPLHGVGTARPSKAPGGGTAAHASAGPTSRPATAQPETATAPTSATVGTGGTGGTPAPLLVGLCRAYLAKQGPDRGKALDSPAFLALITTAGGRESVDAYCAALLSSVPGNDGSSHSASPHNPPKAPANDTPTERPGDGKPKGTSKPGH